MSSRLHGWTKIDGVCCFEEDRKHVEQKKGDLLLFRIPDEPWAFKEHRLKNCKRLNGSDGAATKEFIGNATKGVVLKVEREQVIMQDLRLNVYQVGNNVPLHLAVCV